MCDFVALLNIHLYLGAAFRRAPDEVVELVAGPQPCRLELQLVLLHVSHTATMQVQLQLRPAAL